MKLSKSKPIIKHKNLISLNLNTSNLKNCILKNNNNPNEQENLNSDNQNFIKRKDSDLINSTQLDWVNSAIEIKTKNNKIIKLSLENENLFYPDKIKVNKLKKYTEDDNNINNLNNNDNIDNESENKKNFNKIDNKENEYLMISTKASEKLDNNYKYLSNKKTKNFEIIFPERINNINDENNEEDIVNMRTLTIFNAKTKIYKRKLNTGFLNSKKFFQSKILSINDDYFFQDNKELSINKENDLLNSNNKKTTKNILLIDRNQKILKKNISLTNTNKYLNYEKTENKMKNKDENKLNLTKLREKQNPIFSKYVNIDNDNSIKSYVRYGSNNSNKIQSNKIINPNKNNINIPQKYLSQKPIKKHISQKFLLSSNNKSNLLLRNFLSQINLQKYFSILKINGFDNINLLIEQMKTNAPIKDSELKKAGIKIPGDRAKILIRLEEKGNLFPFNVPKTVYYSVNNNINKNSLDEDKIIINLKKWLKEFKMENYLNNFIQNGYHSVELFLFQMISKNPIDDDILQFEIGIEKIGHRSRILSILKEESKNIIEKLEKTENIINFKDDNQNCGCSIY